MRDLSWWKDHLSLSDEIDVVERICRSRLFKFDHQWVWLGQCNFRSSISLPDNPSLSLFDLCLEYSPSLIHQKSSERTIPISFSCPSTTETNERFARLDREWEWSVARVRPEGQERKETSIRQLHRIPVEVNRKNWSTRCSHLLSKTKRSNRSNHFADLLPLRWTKDSVNERWKHQQNREHEKQFSLEEKCFEIFLITTRRKSWSDKNDSKTQSRDIPSGS